MPDTKPTEQPPFEGFVELTQENWPAGVECFGWICRDDEWERCILRFTYAQLSYLVGPMESRGHTMRHERSRDEALSYASYMIEAPK